MASPDLRVMIDANVIFAGVVWPRWSFEVLRHAEQGDFHLVLSTQIIAEARKNVALKYPGFVTKLEQYLTTVGYELVSNPSKAEVAAGKGLCRHETDAPIALAAIKAEVQCFVTNDQDWTVKDKTTAQLHRRLRVLLPAVFLRDMMGWTSETLEQARHRTWRDLRS